MEEKKIVNKFIRLKEHRDKLNNMLSRLSFNEKKYILKKVDERVIKSSNRLLEEKDKFKKLPNRFKDEKVASIIHLTRNIFASHEIDELYKTKRSENIRVVK